MEQRQGDATRRSKQLRSPGRTSWGTWPVYEGAELGLRNYWYPVLWSRDLRDKPVPVRLLGEQIVLVREEGRAYALHDRCPHRGVPLHLGTREFPGTITCPYHGWTYELDSGLMCAAITDGPDSPITNKAAVKTFPVEERLGIVWVFVGEDGVEVSAVEEDIPTELLSGPVAVGGRIQTGRPGNWRYAAENGFDEGHAKFLHRNAIWAFRRQMPVWNETEIVRSSDGRWISRRQKAVHWEAHFPGLGTWSQARWWKRSPQSPQAAKKQKAHESIADMDLPGMVSVRLPYILRVAYTHYIHYEWAIPEDAEHHRYVQLMVSFKPNLLDRLAFALKYVAYIRWAFHGQFTGQDAWMVDVMDIPPERLYRPDASVIEWRKLVEEQHRSRSAS